MKHAPTRLLGLVGVALLTGSLTACGVLQNLPEPPAVVLQQLEKRGYRLGETVRAVPSFSISGWNYLDDHHMQIDGGPGRAYLVIFPHPCRELAWADRIGYTDSAGTFGRGERIVVLDMGRHVDCVVGELYKLEHIERDQAAPGRR